MSDHIVSLAVSLISAVLAPFIVRRMGGGSPPAVQQMAVHGSHNTIRQTLDQSTTQLEVIYQHLPAPHRAQQSSSEPGPEDEWWVPVAGVLMAVAVLVLAYIFVWPFVVWAFVGSAVGLMVMAIWTGSMTRGAPGPRVATTIAVLISSAALLVAAWWTLDGGPGSDISFARIDGDVASRYPNFTTGMSERWNVLLAHRGEILQILGWEGFIFVTLQIAAVVLAALLVWQRARELSGWIALHNFPKGPTNGKLIERTSRFKDVGKGTVAATLLAAVVIGLVSGGWAHSWYQDLQVGQIESITTR
ncbi:hypothetical protein L6241_14255 [Janibacter sp. Y6]|uniref:hypothetical protein n=1 Tax=Janibacter sp. Y6 TaxID=2913552 RepID=UPI0034A52651